MDLNIELLQWSTNVLKQNSAKRANKFAGIGTKNNNISNQELSKELHERIMWKFKIKKHIRPLLTKLGVLADLVDMQLISRVNRGVFYYVLLKCSLDTYGLFL